MTQSVDQYTIKTNKGTLKIERVQIEGGDLPPISQLEISEVCHQLFGKHEFIIGSGSSGPGYDWDVHSDGFRHTDWFRRKCADASRFLDSLSKLGDGAVPQPERISAS